MLSIISSVAATVSVAGILLAQVGGPPVLGDKIAQNTNRPEAVQERIEARAQEREERRQQIQERVEARREEARERFEARKAEATRSAQQRREEVRERIQEMRDEQRARLTERLVANIDKVNQNWVNHWLRVLDSLSEILVKLESRADKFEEMGADVSETRVLIEAAHGAIADAQNVLNEQAGKVYEIEFTDDESVGAGISSAIQELHTDLRATKESVQDAKRATVDALSSLKAAADDTDEDNGEPENGDDEPEESTQGAELDV